MEFGSIVKVLGIIFGALVNLGVFGKIIGKLEAWIKNKKLISGDLVDKFSDYATDAVEDWAAKKIRTGGKIDSSQKFDKAVSIVESKAKKLGIKLPANEVREAVGAAVTRMNRVNPR